MSRMRELGPNDVRDLEAAQKRGSKFVVCAVPTAGKLKIAGVGECRLHDVITLPKDKDYSKLFKYRYLMTEVKFKRGRKAAARKKHERDIVSPLRTALATSVREYTQAVSRAEFHKQKVEAALQDAKLCQARREAAEAELDKALAVRF